MERIAAIDVHGHFGRTDGFPQKGMEKSLMYMSGVEMKQQYEEAGIETAFLSPAEGIFPFGEYTVVRANAYMEQLVETFPWMYLWAVIHPGQPETFEQAEHMLKNRRCAGLKIHPDAHGYKISEYGECIFEFAARYHAVVESHSGGEMSQPECFVEFADRYPETKILLSHLGNNWDGDVTHQIRAIQMCRHGNLCTDTSSVKSILPHLIEWAVSEIGAEHILFGTDAPLHHIGMMRSRIDNADITLDDKKKILYKNARKIFPGIL